MKSSVKKMERDVKHTRKQCKITERKLADFGRNTYDVLVRDLEKQFDKVEDQVRATESKLSSLSYTFSLQYHQYYPSTLNRYSTGSKYNLQIFKL